MGIFNKFILKFVAENRQHRFSKYLVKVSQKTLRMYENYNFDIAANGELVLLKKLSAENVGTIFDVGANTGDYARICADVFPRAKVHCFEVLEKNREILKERFHGRDNVVINACGLSDETGSLQFNLVDNTSALTSIYAAKSAREVRAVSCPVKKGDDYTREMNISRIDFMKIDVEGMEHLVLKGFSGSLDRGEIEIIQFEYGLSSIYSRFFLIDFYRFFEKYGFRVGKIYPRYVDFRDYKLNHEEFIGSNYLAVKKDRRDLIELLTMPAR